MVKVVNEDDRYQKILEKLNLSELTVKPIKSRSCFENQSQQASYIGNRVGIPIQILTSPIKGIIQNKFTKFFHILMLRWYRSNPSHAIIPDEIELQTDLSYLEETVKMLA